MSMTTLSQITATNPSPSSHIPVGLNFRNRAMLFDETLIKLFDTDIGFKSNHYFAWQLKLFCNEENQFMCQGTLFQVCRR